MNKYFKKIKGVNGGYARVSGDAPRMSIIEVNFNFGNKFLEVKQYEQRYFYKNGYREIEEEEFNDNYRRIILELDRLVPVQSVLPSSGITLKLSSGEEKWQELLMS